MNSENTVVCQKLKFRGTEYKKGLLVIRNENEFGPGFARIILLLVKKSHRKEVFVIVELKDSKWLPDIGMHCIEHSDNMGTVECLNIELLLDYYPLSVYQLNNLSLVPLHHSVACMYE